MEVSFPAALQRRTGARGIIAFRKPLRHRIRRAGPLKRRRRIARKSQFCPLGIHRRLEAGPGLKIKADGGIIITDLGNPDILHPQINRVCHGAVHTVRFENPQHEARMTGLSLLDAGPPDVAHPLPGALNVRPSPRPRRLNGMHRYDRRARAH